MTTDLYINVFACIQTSLLCVKPFPFRRCFESRDRWSLRDLLHRCKVSAEILKEALQEIALKNTKGPYVNLYQLKPEYKQRTRAT